MNDFFVFATGELGYLYPVTPGMGWVGLNSIELTQVYTGLKALSYSMLYTGSKALRVIQLRYTGSEAFILAQRP